MPCEFTVPAVDPDAFDPEQANLRWRLADPLEMGGPNLTQPVGATINELTGFFAWDTSAITFTEGYHNLYSTQVIIEDTTSGPQPQPISKVALDFFIRIVDLPGPPADIIQIPLRWCGMSGSPSMMQPSYYFNLQTHNAVLLKRMREVNDNIFYHQAGIQFISGARFSDFDFPIIVGENPDGHFRASMAGTDRDRAVNLCRLEWRDEDPAVTGMVAVNLNRFIDSTGVPTDTIVGIARVTNPLDPGLQLLMGVATVSDWAYLVEQPDGGLPTPRLYYDPNQKWLGHELGHGLSLEQTTTDKHLHDGQNLMDNEDYYAIEIKPYQREHIRIQASYIPDIKLGSIPRKFVASTWPDTLDDTPVSEAFIDMDTIGIGVDQDLSKTHLAASTFSLFPDNITGLNYYFSIDLDNNSSTGGSPGVVGVPGDAQGIELVGRVQVDVTAGVAQGTPFVWKFQDGQFVQVTDPSIQAIVETAYDTAASTFQTTQGPTPKGQIIQLLLSNDLRGPFADDIRFVANAENSSTGTVDSVEGSITFVPPTFPTCQVDPDSALLGSTVNVSASSLPANHAFSVFLGTQQVATGTTDIAGNVNINFAIPMDTTAGTRPVSVYADGTAVAADCVIQLWSGPKFDVPPSPASGSAFTINAGETLTFTVQASDADAASGDVITLDVIDLPAGASFPVPAPSNPAAATFSWTPTNDQVGSYVVLFTARDSFGLAATPLSVTITVQSGLVSCTSSNQFNASQTSLQPTSISLASSSLTNFSGLPLAFVPNRGQTDNTVRFQVRGLSGSLFFTPGEVSISLPNPLKVPAENDEEREEVRFDLLPPSVVRIHYQGADPHPEISATDALPGVVNYLLGDDPANWRTNLPTYAGIAYREIYPGIELKYEGTDGVLKSAFNVAPGADPAAIRWRYTGATGMSLDESGNLVVDLPAPMQGRDGITLIERAPTAWQVVDETRVMVPVNYSLETGRFLTKDSWQGDYTRPMSYNGWLYVYSNPVNLTDPAGTDPIDDIVKALRDETEKCYNEGDLACVWRNYYALAVGGNVLGYTHAADHLFQFLFKRGDINYQPVPQNSINRSSYWVFSSNAVQTELPDRESEILGLIHDKAKSGIHEGHLETDRRAVDIPNTAIDRDLYYAMNIFTLWAEVDYEISGCYEVTVKPTFRFWDAYNWHIGLAAGGPAIGVAGFLDEWTAALHDAGLALEYEISGYWFGPDKIYTYPANWLDLDIPLPPISERPAPGR